MMERIDMESEMQLIEKACQNNDMQAFDELLDAHMPIIYSLANRLHTSVQLHEELIQAGRIGFMCALRKYRAENNTRLITYAFPWILGEMKRIVRTYETYRSNCVAYEDIEICWENCSQQAVVSNTDYIDLKAALVTLSKYEQQILILRYFRGKTQKETALLLNKSQGQISKTEQRLLAALKRHLEET